ncbi:hypothetical protein [Streptomyces sp. NPDC001530]|uniref:hypothetical protein n=1 Tax=Streptomyces sp. NPDC001530 TaxID=3364582 RepID=UPI0036B52202
MTSVLRLSGISAAASLCLALVPVTDAQAQSTFVPCSSNRVALLRAAINSANAAGQGSIALASNCTYSLTDVDPSESQPSSPDGLPEITGDVTLSAAPGATIERSMATGTPNFRIFTVEMGGKLSLNNITVRNGKLVGAMGAGISNHGTLNVRVGGIRNNETNSVGGGLENVAGATATLDMTTVSGNKSTADAGGGIANSGTLRANYTMLSGNTAQLQGGGLVNLAGQATFAFGSVTGNTSNSGLGGGIYEQPGSMVTAYFTSFSGNMPNNCRPMGAVPGCAN